MGRLPELGTCTQAILCEFWPELQFVPKIWTKGGTWVGGEALGWLSSNLFEQN